MADALEKLIGQELPFYGVDNNSFRLGIDTFNAIEYVPDMDDPAEELIVGPMVIKPLIKTQEIAILRNVQATPNNSSKKKDSTKCHWKNGWLL